MAKKAGAKARPKTKGKAKSAAIPMSEERVSDPIRFIGNIIRNADDRSEMAERIEEVGDLDSQHSEESRQTEVLAEEPPHVQDMLYNDILQRDAETVHQSEEY